MGLKVLLLLLLLLLVVVVVPMSVRICCHCQQGWRWWGGDGCRYPRYPC